MLEGRDLHFAAGVRTVELRLVPSTCHPKRAERIH